MRTRCADFRTSALDMTGAIIATVYRIMSCNDAFAPIAQIGMRLARADSWPMTPATGALLYACFRRRTRSLLSPGESSDHSRMKNSSSSSLIDFRRDIGV